MAAAALTSDGGRRFFDAQIPLSWRGEFGMIGIATKSRQAKASRSSPTRFSP
jgi:hypothetical protein